MINNDYIVFFTEGFDQHQIARQISKFPEAYFSCHYSNPDYNLLKEDAKIAEEKGFKNFYLLWEKDDIYATTVDLQNEFKQFKEARALPYSEIRLLESDVQQPIQQQQTAQYAAQPQQQQAQTQPIQQTQQSTQQQAQNAQQPQQQQAVQQPQNQNISFAEENKRAFDILLKEKPQGNVSALNISNVIYAEDHTISIFIWPVNVFTGVKDMRNACSNLHQAVLSDNVSKSLTAVKTTSTIYSNKKGDWQRIIIVPQSIKQLGQNIARADSMYHFIMNTLLNSDIFKQGSGQINGNPMVRFLRMDANKGGARHRFSGISKAEILKQCNKISSLATANNIVIFCPRSYKQYFSWCKRVVELPAVTSPDPVKNNIWYEAFESGYNFLQSLEQSNRSGGGVSGVPSPSVLANKLLMANLKQLEESKFPAFYSYFQLFVNRNDVHGIPDGSMARDIDKSALSKTLDAIQNFFGKLRHKDDLRAIRIAAGIETEDGHSMLQDLSSLASTGRNTGKVARSAWNKVSAVTGPVARKIGGALSSLVADGEQKSGEMTDAEKAFIDKSDKKADELEKSKVQSKQGKQDSDNEHKEAISKDGNKENKNGQQDEKKSKANAEEKAKQSNNEKNQKDNNSTEDEQPDLSDYKAEWLDYVALILGIKNIEELVNDFFEETTTQGSTSNLVIETRFLINDLMSKNSNKNKPQQAQAQNTQQPQQQQNSAEQQQTNKAVQQQTQTQQSQATIKK